MGNIEKVFFSVYSIKRADEQAPSTEADKKD
jgi:hypothetical protein